LSEIGFGGDIDAVKPLTERIGKEFKVSEVFSPNELIDVVGVTKGKGFSGVIKRFGVALMPHKTEKSRRKVGSLGSWTPSRTPWQVPMAGQLGYFLRTEYNKEILYIGNVSEFDINPKSGWHRYGTVRSDFLLIKGSIPGPAKRPVKMRKAIRPLKGFHPNRLREVVAGNEVKRV